MLLYRVEILLSILSRGKISAERINVTCLSNRALQKERERERERERRILSWVKSASMFACLLNIKETFKLIRFHTQAKTNIVFIVQTSLFLLVLVSPFLSEPWKTALKHPGTSLEVLRPHTEQGPAPLFTSFSCHTQHFGMLPLLIFNLDLLFRFLLLLVPYAELCMPTLPFFHLLTRAACSTLFVEIFWCELQKQWSPRMIYCVCL